MGRTEIKTRKRQKRSLAFCTSPRSTFLTPHSSFIWCDEDIWTEIAKFLDGKSLIMLGMVSRWFRRLMTEDSVWKYACLRDLQVPPPLHVSVKWMQLYTSAFDGRHSYSFRQQEKHIDWMRIGAFFFDSSTALLMENLTLPKSLIEIVQDREKAIKNYGTCILTKVKPGIWIADLQLVRCPVCNLNTCEGTMQTLDTRHAELFLQENYKNGTWDYEDIGSHAVTEHCSSAAGGIFDLKHIRSRCTAEVLDLKSWIVRPNDWQPKARVGIHAVAINTNLQQNEGLNVRYQAMRGGADGEVVSIRVSQQLI